MTGITCILLLGETLTIAIVSSDSVKLQTLSFRVKAAECVQCRSVLQISERESPGRTTARQPCRSERQYEVVLYTKQAYSMPSELSSCLEYGLYLSMQHMCKFLANNFLKRKNRT